MIIRNFSRTAVLLCWAALGSSTGCSDGGTLETEEAVRSTEQSVFYYGNSFSEVGGLPYWHAWFDESRATASLVDHESLSCTGGQCTLTTVPHDIDRVSDTNLPLCSDEPFRGQPVGSSCTAFLVAKDIMVTAGHCADDVDFCENTAVLFDFTVNRNTAVASTTFEQDREVYYCAERLALAYEGGNVEDDDFAVFRLDRETTGRVPLPLRESGVIENWEWIDTLGTFLGLPLKLETGGIVMSNDPSLPRFETSTDSGPGLSGAPVFNTHTGLVEGILVQGPNQVMVESTDHDGSPCARSIQCASGGCDDARPWSQVSRIERVVEVLEDRSCFDGKKNGNESDVDCGGDCERQCAPGQGCFDDDDCHHGIESWVPDCHRPSCDAGSCAVDRSTCECDEDSDCDDGNPCTRDWCTFISQCRHVDECN